MKFNNLEIDARLKGLIFGEASPNSTTEFYYIFDFDCKFNGLDFYVWNSNAGDNITLETQYNANPDPLTRESNPVWLRYKKFGKNWYVFPNVNKEIVLFPTTPKAGVRLVIKYNNVGNSAAKLAINGFIFTDSESVNPSLGQQGTDW